jgi:fibronectin type 3 domain-containing protein
MKTIRLMIALLTVLGASAIGQAVCNPALTPYASGITTTSYVDSVVTDGATYNYDVVSVELVQGGTAIACALPTVTVTIPPTGTHTVSLTWIASTTSGVTYSVFRAPPPTPPTGFAGAVN